MSWKVYRELGEIIRSIPLVNIRPEATEGAFNKNASVSIKDIYNMRHALHCFILETIGGEIMPAFSGVSNQISQFSFLRKSKKN